MNQENQLRYSIKMKKIRKIFNLTISLLMLIPSIVIMALQIFFYITERETEFPVFLGTLIFPIIFLIFGICGIAAVVKKVDVYKGKIIYRTLFKKFEYHMSDIKTTKAEYEEATVGYLNDITPVTSSDYVTTFYNKSGKKLFKFDVAYENVERLQKDVLNTQKSIINQSKNGRKFCKKAVKLNDKRFFK